MATKRSTKTVLILRWVARITGTIVAGFTLTRFAVEILAPGGLNVEVSSHWVLLILLWMSSFGLLFAWRWEGFGGLLAAGAILVEAIASVFILQNPAVLIMSVLFLIPALLFVYCWRATKRTAPAEPVEEPVEVHHEPA